MSHPGRVSHSVPDHHMQRSGMGSHCRCGCQIDSAARSTRGPALTDDVSTLDVSTQVNGQKPEGLFINGAQSVLVLISLIAARSFAQQSHWKHV